MNEYELSLWKEMYIKAWCATESHDVASGHAEIAVRRLREADEMFYKDSESYLDLNKP